MPATSAGTPLANGNGLLPSSHGVVRCLYASMLRIRMLAEGGWSLSGSELPLHTCGLGAGDEAIIAGVSLDLVAGDAFVVPGAQVPQSAWMEHILSQSARNGTQPEAEDTPWTSRVSTHPFNQGTGWALTQRLEKQGHVVVALSVEEEAAAERWHEAIKFAGIHKLPVIFVLKRNSIAEADASERSPALEEVSFMVRECGFPAVIVDGKDAMAVWRVTQESIHRARNGAGPTMIECDTGPSQGSDPLAQMEGYMRKRNAWNDQWRLEAAKQIQTEMEAAFAAAGARIIS